MSVTFSKPFIYGQAIFWGGAILALGIFGAFQIFKDFERTPYKTQLESYLESPQNPLLNRYSMPKESVVIKGKLIVVNLKDKTIDPIFNDLPQELKPENPEQVKTVLWIQCSPEPSYQKYTDGSTAYDNVCKLTFIDFINKKYLWEDKVSVSPPLSKRSRSNADVSDPSDNILRYLTNIPHQE